MGCVSPSGRERGHLRRAARPRDTKDTSKREYVAARLQRNSDNELIDIAQRVYAEYPTPSLLPFIPKRIARQVRANIFEEFLATRLERPEGVAPVTLDDMERAIAEGALGHAFR